MSGDLSARPPDLRVRRNPTARGALRGWVLTGIAGLGFLIVALVVAAYFDAAFGVQASLLALAAAVVPLGIVIPTFLWLDRFESEPNRLLVGAFLWGALVAAVVSALLNTTAMSLIEAMSTADPDAALTTTAVLVAPFVEEAAKGVLILLVWWFLHREFDGITDGMVYAGICAAGFAFTENIQYLAQAWTDGGSELLTGIGIAATSRSWMPRLLAPVAGFLLAVLSHGLWNLAAVTGGQGMVIVYLFVQVPIFFAFLAFVAWVRRTEGHLIGQFLRPYADVGWLSPAEVAMLSSMPHRREARAWARANTGRDGLKAMRAFQDAASELALLRRRMSHRAADAHAIEQEHELLLALRDRRAEFIGLPAS